MRSIRLSLMVYFLVLLAVALGAVGGLAYWSTATIVERRKEATKQLLCNQHERRTSREQRRLDNGLLMQARYLATVAQFQFQGNRTRVPTLAPLGILSASLSPSGHVQVPAWLAESVRGPLSQRIYQQSMAQIQFNEVNLPPYPKPDPIHQDVSPTMEYFQITSEWGSTWHSRSMEGLNFPVDSDDFKKIAQLDYKFDDYSLAPWQVVRRITLKAPVSRFRYRVPGTPPNSTVTRSPAEAAQMLGPPSPADLSERVAESAAPAMLIQVAADTVHLNEVLRAHKAEHEQQLAMLDRESAETLASLRNRLLGIGLATFLATVLGGFALVRLGLSPLRRLSEAVSRVSERDFRLQFDEPKLPTELRPIVERLTQTLEQLQRAFTREKQATADISHELRTPLAALLTTTEVGLRKSRPAEEYRQLLEDCRSIGQQLNHQVEKLLALARLDAGVDRLRTQEVDAAALAKQCADLVRPLAEARELKLQVHHNGDASLVTDADKLREVLTNLLHNAVEYNRPRGTIDLTVRRDNGTLQVEVRDTGIGIAPEAQQQIFQRFYRVDASRQEAGLHSGLGLAIVKGYIDLLGGTISVESTPGQGSAFRIRLPAHKSDKLTR
jgi:heavy metal sensor kinase